MKIFSRRPLSLILCIMLGAFSLFSKITQPFNYILWILAALIVLLSFVKPSFKKIPRGFIRVATLAFLLASLLSHFYFNTYYKAYERFSDEVSLVGEITEIKESQYYTYLTVKTDNIDEESNSRYKILVELDYDERRMLKDLKVGMDISLTGKISDFNDNKSNFNSNSYYHSKGYSGKITEPSCVEISGEEKTTIFSFFAKTRERAASFIIENSDEESGGLLAALLLGDKEYLSPSINLNFRRIGISHILALSGMHLAILALGFAKLLSLLGVGKKLGTLATLIFTILYMALTGFPISVVRAGIMLVISSLLFLFASASDSFTNLSLSVFLIVLINPYSIFDISLLLSAFATLGIVVLADLPKNYVHKKKLWFKILNSFVISLFAISATFLISVLSFEEISVLSPLSTFIFALLVEVFLYFGTFFMIFGAILPLGGILTFFGDIIKNLAERFSSIRYITVNNDFLFIKITAVSFTIIFFLFLILDFKNKRRGVALISSFMALILLSGVIFTYNAENKERLTYYKTDKGDDILLTDKSEISLIESKTYTKSKIYETLNYLNEEKLTRLDNYILTDYNSKLPSALYALLSELKISNIYLPKPRSDEEIIIYQKILSLEESFDVYIEVYDTEKIEFECFDFNSPYREAEIGIFSIAFKNKEYRILSSGVFDSKAQNIAIKEINSADYLIMSRHGKSYKDYNFTYEFKNLKAIIISSKNVYIPKETKEYYKESGAKLNFTPEKYEFIR